MRQHRGPLVGLSFRWATIAAFPFIVAIRNIRRIAPEAPDGSDDAILLKPGSTSFSSRTAFPIGNTDGR
jgi:hypothetical protein